MAIKWATKSLNRTSYSQTSLLLLEPVYKIIGTKLIFKLKLSFPVINPQMDKIIVFGDSGVGKSTFIRKLFLYDHLEAVFKARYLTQSKEFYEAEVLENDFRYLRLLPFTSSLDQAIITVFMFSVNSASSFAKIKNQ